MNVLPFAHEIRHQQIRAKHRRGELYMKPPVYKKKNILHRIARWFNKIFYK